MICPGVFGERRSQSSHVECGLARETDETAEFDQSYGRLGHVQWRSG